TVGYFREPIGVVGGFTILESRNHFAGMQALDWVYLFGLASAAAGWKEPLTAIGNNLSVRRSAYDATGGFEKIPFSVTEDYALVQAIVTRTKYEVAFPVRPRMAVQSQPCGDTEQLFRQKQRWGVGGLDMVFRGMLLMLVGWCGRAALFVALGAGIS